MKEKRYLPSTRLAGNHRKSKRKRRVQAPDKNRAKELAPAQLDPHGNVWMLTFYVILRHANTKTMNL